MIEDPLVSVYIPTRNRRTQLAMCLRGVLSQQGVRLDVVVVDDASDDGTPRLLRRLARKGLLRCHLLQTQSGAQAARNRAIELAKGEIITGADDDDVWLPGRVTTMLHALQEGAAFVAATDIVDLGNGLRYLQRRPPRITLDALLRRNVVGNQVMTHIATLRACGPFDETLPASQDYDLWIRLALQAGEGVGISRPLQWVDASVVKKRISTSSNRRRGVWLVYRRYRHLMTVDQRRSHLFNVLRTLDRPLSFGTARALYGPDNRVRVILHFFRSRIPFLETAIVTMLGKGQKGIISTALADCSSVHGEMRSL